MLTQWIDFDVLLCFFFLFSFLSFAFKEFCGKKGGNGKKKEEKKDERCQKHLDIYMICSFSHFHSHRYQQFLFRISKWKFFINCWINIRISVVDWNSLQHVNAWKGRRRKLEHVFIYSTPFLFTITPEMITGCVRWWTFP